MTFIRRHSRLVATGVCCAAAGAGAGAIATAGAATGSNHGAANGAATAAAAKQAAKSGRGLRPFVRLARRAVDGNVVVRTKTGYATVTFERGLVSGVNGQQLTIAEGNAKSTYKTVTVTIPSNAVVRDDGQKATLAAVKDGQRVLVLTAPKRTYVIARTPRATSP